MAIITISRQIASFGDEVATELARELGYSFINRKLLESDLLKRGLTPDKLLKYDERKPGFWASLARDRDEYFDYLREAVYERAKTGNCVMIGRGGFAILKDIPGCYSIRLVGSDSVRVRRLMEEFSWPEKKAEALMTESDSNRRGFHRCFFNIDNDDSSSYHLVLNTDYVTPESGSKIITNAFSLTMRPESEAVGLSRIGELLLGQKIVNHVVFDMKVPVHFLDASVSPTQITMHGVADSAVVIEKVLEIARSMAPDKKVVSGISIVQEFKSYP